MWPWRISPETNRRTTTAAPDARRGEPPRISVWSSRSPSNASRTADGPNAFAPVCGSSRAMARIGGGWVAGMGAAPNECVRMF